MWRSFWLWYFEPKPFETAGNGRLYRVLGIRFFKRYLPTSGDVVSRWKGVSRIRRAHMGLEQALRRYERVTRSYEARHIVGGLSMLALSWWSISVHSKGQWSVLLVANALINGYPIILQRYNRVRLHRALTQFAALRDRREADRPLASTGAVE
jgi:Glycosyl-4,4'-diaponeurosporenoate acyltransferase